MKKIAVLLLVFVIFCGTIVHGESPYSAAPNNNAKAAMVYNLDTDQIIYEIFDFHIAQTCFSLAFELSVLDFDTNNYC